MILGKLHQRSQILQSSLMKMYHPKIQFLGARYRALCFRRAIVPGTTWILAMTNSSNEWLRQLLYFLKIDLTKVREETHLEMMQKD